MRVTQLIQPLLELGEPLTSPFLALLVVLVLPLVFRRTRRWAWRLVAVALVLGGFALAYQLAVRAPRVERWMTALNSPLVAAFLLVVLPALYLPRGRWYKLFLLLPGAFVALAGLSVAAAYAGVPPGRGGFYWALIRPAWLIAGLASLLVLIQPLLTMSRFRWAVRCTCVLVLVYGGFAFRQSYEDYQAMVQRRPNVKPDIMNLSETSPVLQNDHRMTYLPSAPCRFTADGGYVQGCNLELFQRLMQADWRKAADRDVAAVGALSVGLGALALLLTTCFLTGRAACGWICPLSALGDVLDWARRKVGLPHWKPSQPVKLTCLFTGLGVAGIGLLMARLYPYLNADGKVLGCKLPLYPFCKICPSQQICPVAAHGPANYAGLPTWEWGFGFFRIASVGLLTVFLVSFFTSRRLWCRLCPMGVLGGLFNRGGMTTLRKDPQKCNRCGVCAEVCPMDIDSVRAEMVDTNVSSFDCVLCLKCVEKCPRDKCLSLEHAGVEVTASRFDAKAP